MLIPNGYPSAQDEQVPKSRNEEVARLQRLNDELSDSLQRCRKMLHDYEVRLTANSNDEPAGKSDDEEKEA